VEVVVVVIILVAGVVRVIVVVVEEGVEGDVEPLQLQISIYCLIVR
jgi:hypothetical protein